jgi:AcrR family transcriptional regulator
MSQSGTSRTLRRDAERNLEAILRAAVTTLAARPDATMEEIARAAGVARQTIYARYPSREALIRAVQQQAMEQTVSLLDSARLDDDAPDVALERLLDTSWEMASAHGVFHLPMVSQAPEDEYEGHRPFLDRLEPLVRRGQRDGVFDSRLPAPWLVAAFIGLAHTAGQEVRAGRMKPDDGLRILKRSLWRLYGIDAGAQKMTT